MFESLIPYLMTLKGWTATRLQRETKMAWGTALDLSHGDIPGSTKTLAKLCEAFDCQPNDLIVYKKESE